MIAAGVIEHVERHRQNTCWRREAGGQLFGQIGDEGWRVVVATGPRRSDLRSRFGFVADRRAEQREIDQLFANGLHYVGDWHTHPQEMPRPSSTDLTSMQKMVSASRHELPGFLMLIVGTLQSLEGLWLSFHPSSGATERIELDMAPIATGCDEPPSIK